MADLKGVTACLKSFNTGKAWLPSSRLRQYNEKPGILHLSTNLYVSLSFAACQSWRSNGMTDKHILYGTSFINIQCFVASRETLCQVQTYCSLIEKPASSRAVMTGALTLWLFIGVFPS